MLKDENELIKKLKNEITKIKEQLENHFSDSNLIIKNNEKINKGIKYLEKEEDKNMLKTLSYISKINKTKKEMRKLDGKLMKNLNIEFNEEKSSIKYEDYFFNGIQVPIEIEFKDIENTSFKVNWKIDDINIIGIDNKQIKYKVEIKKESADEKFIQIYEGNNNNCSIEKLNADTNYEIRIACFYNSLIGSWSDIKNIKTKYNDKKILNESLILNNEKDKIKSICEWINPNKILDFKLLFRMSRDGSNCSDFHRFCDNKGETLLLFQTDKNYRFGAYTPLNWTSPNSGEVNDPNDNLTFLFSLNKMKKFTTLPGKNPQTARSQKGYGPLLGGGTDLGIYDDMKNGWTNNGTFLKERELTNGDTTFKINEIEIYQVL